jgi:hypothetical protein
MAKSDLKREDKIGIQFYAEVTRSELSEKTK